MSVPSNLVPTRILQLPEDPAPSNTAYMMYVNNGVTYKVQVSAVLNVSGVPGTRTVIAGTGLTGGGALSSNITISVAPGGIGASQLSNTGVTAGVYGDTSNFPVLTVDANGRVTAATTLPVPLTTGYVPTSRQIIAGSGLSGGGNLTADVTLTNSGVLGVTATSPVLSSGGQNPVISMPAATTSVSGYLTSTDWNTFNNKLSTQVYPGAGIPNSTGSAWGTSYGTTGANSVVLRDANQNIAVNAVDEAFLQQAATTPITLTASSTRRYSITGSGGQTIQLPDATTLANGAVFQFDNNQSSGAITVNNHSGTLVVSVPSGGYVIVILLSNAIAAGSWDRHDITPSNVSWSTNTFSYPGSITSATWNGNTIAVNRGGTGTTTSTGTGSVVLSDSPTFTTTITTPSVTATSGNLNLTPIGSGQLYLNQSQGGAFGTVIARDVAAATSSARLFFDSSAGASSIRNIGGSNIAFSTGALIGSSSGIERMRVSPFGGVSIGTTTEAGEGNLLVTGGATIQGLTVGRGDGNVSTNTAYGFDAIGSPYITSGNTNNVGIGYNALNTIGAGVATLTNRVGGSGYDDGYDGAVVSLIYQSGTPIIAGGVFPTVNLTISGGVITDASIQTAGYGFTDTTTVFTVNNASLGGVGSGFSIQIGSLVSANNITALGYNAGNTQKTGTNSVYIGSGATGTGSNEIVIGTNVTGGGTNTVLIGNSSTTLTILKGLVSTDTLSTGGFYTEGSFTCNINDALKSFDVNANGASAINIGGEAGSTGAINIGKSTGIANAQQINIGGVGNQINIGASASNSNINIGGTTATSTILLGRSTLNQPVEIQNGSASSGQVRIGSTTGTGTIILGRSTGTQAVTIQSGTTGSGLTTIGGSSATGTITVGQSMVSQTVNVAAGSTASGSTKALNIGTGGVSGSATNIGIGSASGTCITTINGAISLLADTQALNLGSNQSTGTIIIGGTGATGEIRIGQSTGNQTVNIATGVNTGSKTVNIGTGTPTGTRNINIGGGGVAENLTFINLGRLGTVGSNVVRTGALLLTAPTTLSTLNALTSVAIGTRAMITDSLTLGNPVGSTAVGNGFYLSPVYYADGTWLYG